MNSLATRLTLGFMLITATIIIGITYTVNQSVDNNFRQFLDESAPINNAGFIAFAQRYYISVGSWNGFQDYINNDNSMMGLTNDTSDTTERNSDTRPNPQGPRRNRINNNFPPFVVTNENFRIVASNDPQQIGRELKAVLQENAIPITYDDQIIGYFTRESEDVAVLAQTEQAFLDDMNNNLQLIAVGTGGIAVVMAILIAWWLSRPLRDLKLASHQVAAGQLGTRVSVSGATEVQDVAKAFNQMSEALAQSERIRRQMFSDIAHELRTPITVMRGQLEGILDGVFERSDIQIGVIYNQILHLGRLVNDLWTLTRAETGTLPLEKSSTDLHPLLEDTVQAFSALAQDENIDLKLEVNGKLSPLEVDSGRLRQVFSNLIANAIRHTKAGGLVQLHVEQDPHWTTVRVQDTGEGMSPEVSELVFNRFYRGEHHDQQGAGLGLAITRELVHLHQGSIEVQSQEGVGTAFVVKLPTPS